MAGWPVALNGQVFEVLPIDSFSLSITLDPRPSGSVDFILGCGMATVGVQGVTRISKSLNASSYAARSSNTLRCALASAGGPNLA